MWEKADRLDRTSYVRGSIPVYHRYTMGVAGERFFRAMRDEMRLLASRCPKCREVCLPPKMYCELCFVETDEWTAVQGPGYVESYTLLHRTLDEEPLVEPEVVAFIAWEGIHGGIIHRVAGAGQGDVRIGTAVEPVWAEERTGSMDDIRHFRTLTG